MTNTEFVERVKAIAAAQPTYRTGGDGSDGTCDCIGLIMGALGGEYQLHSTNYFARCQMRTLDSLLDESQLHEGCIVYKSRRDTEQLNARYQSGGRYYNGDLLDYYHVGVVTSIDPVEITHCTSTDSINGIARDSSIQTWSHFGDLLDVEMIDAGEGNTMIIMMEVYAKNGKTVNVRKRPDINSPKVGEVNVGGHVTVIEQAEGWAKIDTGRGFGYMMSAFLREIAGEAPQESEERLVTITLPRSAAQALAEALKGLAV